MKYKLIATLLAFATAASADQGIKQRIRLPLVWVAVSDGLYMATPPGLRIIRTNAGAGDGSEAVSIRMNSGHMCTGLKLPSGGFYLGCGPDTESYALMRDPEAFKQGKDLLILERLILDTAETK